MPSLRCPACDTWTARQQWTQPSIVTLRCPACGAEHDVAVPDYRMDLPVVDELD